jgi:hypothetical protein
MSYTAIANAARAAAYSEFAVAPPVYSEIPIAAPPIYAEAPHEDLAAELAKMKAMMEQMRLEKERMETEARRKAAEDAVAARFRAEQEEFAAFYKSRTMTPITKGIIERLDGRNTAILDSISQKGEIVLFVKNTNAGTATDIAYLITNKNMYAITNHGKHAGADVCVLYTFDTPIGKKYTMMLESCEYLLKRGLSAGGIDMFSLKKFESVIRLIPGSYKNGDWRQLDGFFGMYFNETTMELSEVPPPSL